MLKKIKQKISCFLLTHLPLVYYFLKKIQRFFKKNPRIFKKNTQGFFEPKPAYCSVWVRKLYHDNMPLYQPKTLKKAKKCLNYALEKRIKHQLKIHTKQFFLDISVVISHDHQTGVQRVVRNIMQALMSRPPHGYHVEPIYGCEDGMYRYARSDEPIDVFKDDIFLGLDLITGWIARYQQTFETYKACGAHLYFVIYDLLPIDYPHFFMPDVVKLFNQWLKQIATQADGAICISQTVSYQLKHWLKKNYLERNDFNIQWFHLGADIETTKTSHDTHISPIPNHYPSILMVSTIEPRKGYALALAAFEQLWAQHQQINLIIVGKPGWKVEQLIQQLRAHPQKDQHLFWYEHVDDTLLSTLYHSAQGLLMASECEGFGLALIEAAQYQLPILARDIPVFREIAGEHARYFSGQTPQSLATDILIWLDDLVQGKAPLSEHMPYLLWSESAEQLVQAILFGNSKNMQ